ncbi:hypothetical protein LOC67_23315 [Stieleria sp. JC731]|uniref:JAB domain-containing protein n=1 Tax=Pirellulaceae TaxID=2691357 RepID=UPI001E44E425|nr:JAB domain-containing protein [Stieleria sp. JC731]MCC9603489.1 hypothetical protein [Stieleria sp. JC731]
MANRYSHAYRVALVREGKISNRTAITSTQTARQFVGEYFAERDDAREVFVVFMLDTKHKVIGATVVTTGTLDASLVHPREVFQPAILANSSAILIAHNHPSGDPKPSREDLQVTDRITDAGNLLGITVLDHIVVGDVFREDWSIYSDVVSIREDR